MQECSTGKLGKRREQRSRVQYGKGRGGLCKNGAVRDILGPLTAPLVMEDMDKAGMAAEDMAGLLGYTVCSILCTGKHTPHVVFADLGVVDEMTLDVPAGDRPFWQFLLEETPDFVPSAQFVGLLTSCL